MIESILFKRSTELEEIKIFQVQILSFQPTVPGYGAAGGFELRL
jgi:hypothetical protein